MTATRTVLHVGCGVANPAKLHPAFRGEDWKEVRLDIDPGVRPDIVASMTDMSAVPDASMDGLFSSHNIEHLYPHEVPVALAEFRRVLKPTGFALITLPDLQAIAQLVAEDKLEEPAYVSPAGPISPLDMMYGYRPALARGNLFMAHRTGFTARTLGQHLVQAGFGEVRLAKGGNFDLWAQAFVTPPKAAAAEQGAEGPAAAVGG
ncbi:MAG TPA: methyltransferase domain-containing protein [Azospirillaceae bacterium]|nr:methyltransferase domain-containing protein [Azospirillaceae bacterium]